MPRWIGLNINIALQSLLAVSAHALITISRHVILFCGGAGTAPQVAAE
jgi:hypothetical protein